VPVRDAAVRDLSLRGVFARARRLEEQYARRLRSLAKFIEIILRGHDVGTPAGALAAAEQMRAYEASARPWARQVATRMVAEVAARDERSWFRVARMMSAEIRNTVQSTDVGQVFRSRVDAQVELITSIPRDAAERVRTIATENLSSGLRAEELAKKIMETPGIAQRHANTIARTETSRTATEFTRVRAEALGGTEFVWRTTGDYDVRPSHKKLNRTTHRWDNPPECDKGVHALPGCVYNCRCWAEPLLTFE
jgi:SPP1 gp7 family putative phage head morphogenesis protein